MPRTCKMSFGVEPSAGPGGGDIFDALDAALDRALHLGLDPLRDRCEVEARRALILVLLPRTIDDWQLSTAVSAAGRDASINSIRMFRNTCGNVAMARSSDQPDEMKWARMPRGMSGWCEALSTTMSDTQLLVGFGNCRRELHSGGGGYQHRLSADSLGGGAYQIRDGLVVDIHGQTCRHRAIAERLEPIRRAVGKADCC